MTIRWPLVTRKTHEHALAEQEHHARQARILLDDEHEKALAKVHAQRVQDLEDYQDAIREFVVQERARCVNIAQQAPTSARGVFVRDHILKAITNAPLPSPKHRDTAATPAPSGSPTPVPVPAAG